MNIKHRMEWKLDLLVAFKEHENDPRIPEVCADMAKEMVHVIECQRAFSYAVKMITTSDDIEGTINSLRG